MKVLKIAFVLMLVSSAAYASVRLFTSSSADLGHFDILQCGSNMTCAKTSGKGSIALSNSLTLTGSITGDGGDAVVGFLHNTITATATTLTIAQCGSTILSAAGAIVITLPEASTAIGCRYTFLGATASDLDINPNDGTDQISVVNSVAGGTGAAITPSAGDAIRITDTGSSITLEAVSANLWVAVGVANGAVTDVN